jgi:hypothetical protein
MNRIPTDELDHQHEEGGEEEGEDVEEEEEQDQQEGGVQRSTPRMSGTNRLQFSIANIMGFDTGGEKEEEEEEGEEEEEQVGLKRNTFFNFCENRKVANMCVFR